MHSYIHSGSNRELQVEMDADDFRFIFVDLQVKEYEVEVAVISERWVLEEDLACYPTNVEDTSLREKMMKQRAKPEEHSEIWLTYHMQIRKICSKFSFRFLIIFMI